jgi:hypothetical protein
MQPRFPAPGQELEEFKIRRGVVEKRTESVLLHNVAALPSAEQVDRMTVRSRPRRESSHFFLAHSGLGVAPTRRATDAKNLEGAAKGRRRCRIHAKGAKDARRPAAIDAFVTPRA